MLFMSVIGKQSFSKSAPKCCYCVGGPDPFNDGYPPRHSQTHSFHWSVLWNSHSSVHLFIHPTVLADKRDAPWLEITVCRVMWPGGLAGRWPCPWTVDCTKGQNEGEGCVRAQGLWTGQCTESGKGDSLNYIIRKYAPPVFQLFHSYCDHKEVHNGQPAVFGWELTEQRLIGMIRLLELQLQLSDEAITLLIIAMWAAN